MANISKQVRGAFHGPAGDSPSRVGPRPVGEPDAGPHRRALRTAGGRAEVLAEEARFKAPGINGVPAFFVNGTPAFSGAVEPRLLADAIRAAREAAVGSPGGGE